MSHGGKPEVLPLAGDGSDDAKIDRAAGVLASGGLVAFPTDTVYGLGADGAVPEAVEKLYTVKGRDRAKPFARLVPDSRAAARAAPRWGRLARKLARAYWPGALTIVAGDVGVRVPDHQAARALASRVNGGLVATSANRSGGPDPRTAREVVEALGGEVDLVIDGGEAGGVPSTVVCTDGSRLEILRAGPVAEDELRLIAAPTVLFVCRGNTCRSPLAAALFVKELEARRRSDVAVLSAGVDVAFRTGDSLGVSAGSLEVAAGAGLDLAGHEVRSLTPSILARADWVFVMERSQIAGITSLLPEEADHIRLLDPAGGGIADPSGGDPEDYRSSLDAIRAGVRARAREILDETDLGNSESNKDIQDGQDVNGANHPVNPVHPC